MALHCRSDNGARQRARMQEASTISTSCSESATSANPSPNASFGSAKNWGFLIIGKIESPGCSLNHAAIRPVFAFE